MPSILHVLTQIKEYTQYKMYTWCAVFFIKPPIFKAGVSGVHTVAWNAFLYEAENLLHVATPV